MKIRIDNKNHHREQISKLIRELLKRTLKTNKTPSLGVNNIIWVNPKRIVYGSLESKSYGSRAQTCLHQTRKQVEAVSSVLEVLFKIPSVGYTFYIL